MGIVQIFMLHEVLLEKQQAVWSTLTSLVQDALVFTDDGMAQTLQWSYPGGISRFLDSAVSLLPLSGKEPLLCRVREKKKIVFLISTFLDDQLPLMFTKAAGFQECLVISSISESAHRSHTLYAHIEHPFEHIRESIAQESGSRVELLFAPLFAFPLCPDLWLIPLALPLVPSEFDLEKSRQFAAHLTHLLDVLHLQDDLFVLGDHALRIARMVVAQSINRKRRESSERCSVILVDRIVDMASYAQRETLLDDLFGSFCPAGECIPKSQMDHRMWTLNHSRNRATMDVFASLSTLWKREGLVKVKKELRDMFDSTFSLKSLTREDFELYAKDLGPRGEFKDELRHLSGLCCHLLSRSSPETEIEKMAEQMLDAQMPVVQVMVELVAALCQQLNKETVSKLHALLLKYVTRYTAIFAEQIDARSSYEQALKEHNVYAPNLLSEYDACVQLRQSLPKTTSFQPFFDDVAVHLDEDESVFTRVSYHGTLGSVLGTFLRKNEGPFAFKKVFLVVLGGMTCGEMRLLRQLMQDRGHEVVFLSDQLVSQF